MPNTIEGLNAEIKQLKVTLAEKEKELHEKILNSKLEKEASRDTAAEARLREALNRVLLNVGHLRVSVYPDKTIITLPLWYSSFSIVKNFFSAFLNNDLLEIKKTHPHFSYVQSIQISFPSVNLPELEKGIKLSEGVDLADDRCSLQADC
jgi:hypothetical protein